MSKIIKAIVESNSCDDAYARVKLSCPDLWDGTPLVLSVGGIPLKKGDTVFVDLSEGFENPLILGRSFDKITHFEHEVNGSVLFESSDGKEWTICFVKCGKLEFYNSSGFNFSLEEGTVSLSNLSKFSLTGNNLTIEYDDVSVIINKSYILNIKQGANLTVSGNGVLDLKGEPEVTDSPTGSFCSISYCPFSGAVHRSEKVNLQ